MKKNNLNKWCHIRTRNTQTQFDEERKNKQSKIKLEAGIETYFHAKYPFGFFISFFFAYCFAIRCFWSSLQCVKYERFQFGSSRTRSFNRNSNWIREIGYLFCVFRLNTEKKPTNHQWQIIKIISRKMRINRWQSTVAIGEIVFFSRHGRLTVTEWNKIISVHSLRNGTGNTNLDVKYKICF